MGRIYGKHNPIFIRWLNHPSYDRIGKRWCHTRNNSRRSPSRCSYTTGYFAVSEPGDLYYFTQHHRYNPHADDMLAHRSIRRHHDAALSRRPALHGYQLDPSALIDLAQLRYQWFDRVFKGDGGAALVEGTSVNYQVMGANEWQYAPSLDAMAASSLKFYLDAAASGAGHRLTRRKNSKAAFVRQTVNFADRTDAGWTPPIDLISQNLVPHNGIMFASDPLTKPTEFNGLFSGRLDFTINKMDVDLYYGLRTPRKRRLRSPVQPTYEFRASYARDRVHRQLLNAGERQEDWPSRVSG